MMDEYGVIVRACMMKSFAGVMRPARKVIDLTIGDISAQSGIPEEVLADIEAGKLQLTDTNYIALAAVFDNVMSQRTPSVEDKILRRILETDYADPALPSCYAELFQNLENEPFLYRWFVTFSDVFNQLFKCEEVSLTDEDLALLAKNYTIFIDGKVLGNKDFPLLISRLEPFLKKEAGLSGKNVTIKLTKDVITQIREEAQNIQDSDEAQDLKSTASAIAHYREAGLLDVFNADDVRTVFHDYRDQYRFILITENRDLAQELLASTDKTRKAPILVAHMCDGGSIALYRREEQANDDDDEDYQSADLDGSEA